MDINDLEPYRPFLEKVETDFLAIAEMMTIAINGASMAILELCEALKEIQLLLPVVYQWEHRRQCAKFRSEWVNKKAR